MLSMLLLLFACAPDGGKGTDTACPVVPWYVDQDGDGVGAAETDACVAPTGAVATGGDCDDTRADVYPGAEDGCDGLDDDCDGVVDEDAALDSWYTDADGDGFGDATTVVQSCSAPAGTVADAGDCDDTDAAVNPDGTEVCGGGDEDCDGSVDEDVGTERWTDADGDGYGAGAAYVACSGGVGNADDCDDGAVGIHPGAAETCDGVDEDCDGATDEGAGTLRWTDADGDGYGAGTGAVACSGGVENGDDCDDADATISPVGTEVCDGVDQDCDGTADDGAGTLHWVDADGDGYGAGTAYVACSGGVENGDDCDDADATISPTGTEVCDGVDQDCDGTADDGAGSERWPDLDGDGYGAGTAYVACSGGAENAEDCDDGDAAVSPVGVEVCDGVDQDCDGTADDGAGTLRWVDADGDGYGAGAGAVACSGGVENGDDCDDADASVSPGGVEVCDGVDQDCDGTADDGVTTSWYVDADGDGYGGSTRAATCSSSPPDGYASTGTDCDDTSPQRHPGAPEVCDGLVDDCVGYLWTSDAGLVTAESADGVWTDLTADWAAGTASASVALPLPTDGTVHVCAGTWYVTLTAPAGADVTVRGEESDVVLDAGYDASSFTLTDATTVLTVESLEADHGAAPRGAVVYNPGGRVRLDGVDVESAYGTGSTAEVGMCVWSDGGSVELVDSTFYVCDGDDGYSSTADNGGIVGAVDADVLLDDVSSSWTKARDGAGVYWTSTTDATLTVLNSDLYASWASNDGGAVYVDNDGTGLVTVDGSTFESCQAYEGGGVWLTGSGPIEVTDTLFDNNSADLYGGGVEVDGATDVVLDGLEGTDNDAGYGGVVYFATDGTLTGSNLHDNGSIYGSDNHGMGVAVASGAVVGIDDTTFRDNVSEMTAAALYVASGAAVTCTSCTFDGNRIDQNGACTKNSLSNPTCGGSAADVHGSLELVDSTLTNGSMDLTTSGGGAVLVVDGTLTLTRTVVEDNSAPYGGGIFAFSAAGTATVSMDSGSAVRGNTATSWGGGLYLSGAAFSCTDGDGTGAWLSGDVGGAIYVDSNTANAVDVSGCELGDDGATDDNTSSAGSPTCDVYVEAAGWWTYEDDATFTCDATGCG